MSAVVLPVDGVAWRIGRRRGRRDARDDGQHWAPKWRRLVCSTEEGGLGPPSSYDEFDRTVRGMLNRVSTENAERLLPVDLTLRSPDAESGDGDSPSWWVARFSALMLTSYIQVIHTNRCARGIAMRSADNILPAYLDAVAPLLAASPRLVDAVAAWLARLLQVHDLCWPTARLLLLAAREPRDRSTLPGCSLGRLPAELLRGRVLRFLVPPGLPTTAVKAVQGRPFGFCECWASEDGRRDAVAVLAHVLRFAPQVTWPRLSTFAFNIAEASLVVDGVTEGRIYLGASILVAISQRLDDDEKMMKITASSEDRARWRHLLCGDLCALQRTTADLERHLTIAASDKPSSHISLFVRSRAQAAVEHAQGTVEKLLRTSV